MNKKQQVLNLYLANNGFKGYNSTKIAEKAGVNRRDISYLCTLMEASTPEQQEVVKTAIQTGEKIKFNNGEVTGSLEICAALVNKGCVVQGCGDPSMVVYILECDSKIKIGVAKSISSRIAAMQTGNPYKITLKSEYRVKSESIARNIEKAVHTKYKHAQLIGEWFTLTDEDLSEIDRYIKEYVTKHG